MIEKKESEWHLSSLHDLDAEASSRLNNMPRSDWILRTVLTNNNRRELRSSDASQMFDSRLLHRDTLVGIDDLLLAEIKHLICFHTHLININYARPRFSLRVPNSEPLSTIQNEKKEFIINRRFFTSTDSSIQQWRTPTNSQLSSSFLFDSVAPLFRFLVTYQYKPKKSDESSPAMCDKLYREGRRICDERKERLVDTGC